MFDTDIHIYETNPNEFVDVTLGIQGKLEPLSKIDNPNIVEVCKINGGFFNYDCSREHLGLFMREGKVIQDYNNTFINFAYNKDGSVDITCVDNYEWINYWKTQSYWVIGCGWCLIKDGKIDLTGSTLFDHSKSKNPRSMIGVKADKSFILAVADGRSTISKGLTAKEQAEVMLSLQCANSCALDGGGSSEMIVNDKIVNKPSDGSERKIGSSIIVYNK
jgi:exopolysaccharide biosynthesis protein